MNRGVTASVAIWALLAVSGCSDQLQLTTTPVKNVDKILVTERAQIDVYCQTGICQFNLASNQAATVTVNMHYDDSRSFNKIEGVSVTGRLGSSVSMADGNTFSLDVSDDTEPLKIQVVDYYRN